MPACPQCGKPLAELPKVCPFCRADLDLLVDYVQTLRGGLERAELFTRQGELDRAVWSYLEVLEADPDNAEAKRQISRVVTAVRTFDRKSSGRKWLMHLRGEDSDPNLWSFLRTGLLILLIAAAFSVGLVIGGARLFETSDTPVSPTPKSDSISGK